MTGSTPVPYFYVTDHLGSVLAVTDANGNLVERYEYDAWGKVLSVTDAEGQTLIRSLRISFGSWNSFILDYYNRYLMKEHSRTQQDDVLERLLEFDKFRTSTPQIPQPGKPLARPDFSRWRRSESPRRK